MVIYDINICSRIFEGYVLLLLNSVEFPLFLFTLPGSCKKLNTFPMTGKDESICGSRKARLQALQSIIYGFPAGFVSVCSPFGMGRTRGTEVLKQVLASFGQICTPVPLYIASQHDVCHKIEMLFFWLQIAVVRCSGRMGLWNGSKSAPKDKWSP